MFTPIAPEGESSTDVIVAIVLTLVFIIAIVAIVTIIVSVLVWRRMRRGCPLSTSVDYPSTEKRVGNAYQQLPGPKPQAKGEVFMDMTAT